MKTEENQVIKTKWHDNQKKVFTQNFLQNLQHFYAAFVSKCRKTEELVLVMKSEENHVIKPKLHINKKKFSRNTFMLCLFRSVEKRRVTLDNEKRRKSSNKNKMTRQSKKSFLAKLSSKFTTLLCFVSKHRKTKSYYW